MSEQKIAKRKTHTKSRKGCLECKKRHTKCNETHPRCSNCIRLDIFCTWPDSAKSPHSPAAYPSPVADSPSQIPVNTFELSIPDMRLLHYWTTKGHIAYFPHLARRCDLWGNGMVELAFSYPFLLHGLLALAAVHQASLLPPMAREELLLQATAHVSPALDTMRRYLQTPKPDEAIPMFVLSSVFLTYNFASGSIQEKIDDPIGSMHHCFMLLNGIKVVIGPHWDTIKDDQRVALMLETTSQTLGALDTVNERPEISRLKGLTELVLSQDDKIACVEAINELHYVGTVGERSRDEYPFLFIWAARVSNRFFDLLAAHNPVACIITCHSAALEAQAHTVWWVLKWPGWLLAATEHLLAKTPDLLEWLDWPRKVIHAASETAAASPGMHM